MEPPSARVRVRDLMTGVHSALAEPGWRGVEAADGDDGPVERGVLRHAEARVPGGDMEPGEPGSFEAGCCLSG
jgi:hypothetical protein